MDDEERLIELMARYQAGHVEAFEEFYRLVNPRLNKFLIVKTLDRSLSEDLLQETFLQIHRSRHTYFPGKPVTPWIFSIAHHVYLNDRRSRIKRHTKEEAIDDHIIDVPVPSDIEAAVEVDILKRAMTGLPPEQRESILLHHYWGFSFREIGRTLGIQTITAKLRAHRGLLRLKENLKLKTVTETRRNNN